MIDGLNIAFAHVTEKGEYNGQGVVDVTQLGKGRFQVLFEPGLFNTQPAIVVSEVRNWGDDWSTGSKTTSNAMLLNQSPDKFMVKIGDSGGSAVDRPFNFIAVGY